MEHGAVTEPLAGAASQNLMHTYLALGQASTGSRVWQERGFHACTGPLDHPICNFAVNGDLSGGVAPRLRQVAAQRRCFSLYTVPPIDDVEAEQTLEREGFNLSHKLSILVAEGSIGEAAKLEEADGLRGRRKIAEFMVDQFFHRQPAAFRRGIAEATAGSSSLRLLRADWNGKCVGAVMISEHAGLLGIYNLCVAPSFRGRGWGSAIVRSVLSQAYEKGLGVTLQCERSLGGWYGSLGFREVGSVCVYGLLRFKEIDIIG